jgi:hypothetical protein
MSHDTNPFNEETFGIDPNIFAPLLKEDLTQVDPPFTIAKPLTDDDFCNNRDSDGDVPYLVTLNKIICVLTAGFLNSKQELSCQQWLCSVSQLLSATLQGLSKFQSGDDFPSTISHLNPEEETAVKDLGKALETFHTFVRETPTAATFNGQQCSRCLQVSGHIITPQHLTAVLKTCNDHVATARTSILNSFTSEFRKELALLRDSERAHMHDQVILQIVSEHYPPYAADPRMIEWCTRKSRHMRSGILAKLAEEAQQACKDDYKHFLVAAQIQHDNDREEVHLSYIKELQEECESYKAQIAQEKENNARQLAQLKADTKAILQQKKSDLEHEGMAIRQVSCKAKRPDPRQGNRTRRPSLSNIAPDSEAHEDAVMTDVEEDKEITPTNSPILPTGAAVAVPKATMLGTGLDLASPQHAEKAQPVTPLAGVYTPSVPQPPPPEDPNQVLMRAFQRMLEDTMNPVYKRLDAIECPLTNAYQPPSNAAKWVDYEDTEDPTPYKEMELEYTDLSPKDAAANDAANA